MTRINVVAPSTLENKHLMGEIHEITRVFGLVRKAQARCINRYSIKEKLKQPAEYTLGTGHVKFFYDKLGYVTDRYYLLCEEATSRGYKVNPIDRTQLTEGIYPWWFGDYVPTEAAKKINQARLDERLAGIKWKE
jgi:hypothetical protein